MMRGVETVGTRCLGAVLRAGAVGLFALVALGCDAGGRAGGSRGRGGGEDAGLSGRVDTGFGGPSEEVCNGVDDDGNGRVDEVCSCAAGATQACWPDRAATRGRGVCRDGVQTCMTTGAEFDSWGPCEGAVLPSTEVPGNCIDEDCDGNMPGCNRTCSEFEQCGNGVDDDCNSLVDCDDPACSCVDCTRNPEACQCEERCVPGTDRYCDEPRFCAWGKQVCGPDGRWGACIETRDIPPACREDPPIPLPFETPQTYDPGCCVRAGHCCQNYGHDPSLDVDASIGHCTGRVERICRPI